jgi:hypothetical protein
MVAATGLSIGDKVQTLGYYSAGDGGGNIYEIVAAGTGTADGGSYIDLTGISGQAKGLFVDGVVNVKQFGAVGDGVADDDAAVKAFFAFAKSGSTLLMQEGTYLVSSITTVQNIDSWALYANGATLKMKDSTPVASGFGILEIKACDDFVIRGLTIDGNRATRTPAEVYAHSLVIDRGHRWRLVDVVSKNAVVDGFYVYNANETVLSDTPSEWVMENCYATNSFRQGMSIIQSHEFTVIGCTFENTNGTAPEAGVDIEANTGAATPSNLSGAFINCTFRGNAGDGALISSVQDAKGIRFIGGHVENNGTAGIEVDASNVVISGVTVKDHTTTGTKGAIYLTSSGFASAVIRDCFLLNNTGTDAAIKIHSAATDMVLVEGNTIDGAKYGIISSSPRARIRNNLVKNTTDVGISSSSADGLLEGNIIEAAVVRGIYSSGARERLLGNTVRNISSVSGAYIQLAGSDQIAMFNHCESSSASTDYAIRVDTQAHAVLYNSAVNLNSNPYTFITSSADDLFGFNIGGTDDRRSIVSSFGIPVYSDGSRPSASSVPQGAVIFNTTDSSLNVSDGSNWRDMTGAIT